MLIKDFLQDCIELIPTTVDDGEGGRYTEWADGSTFTAAIVRDTTSQARIADREGFAASYTVTCPEYVLPFHGVIRASDGHIYRITSEGIKPPACASFDFNQYFAERWELNGD